MRFFNEFLSMVFLMLVMILLQGCGCGDSSLSGDAGEDTDREPDSVSEDPAPEAGRDPIDEDGGDPAEEEPAADLAAEDLAVEDMAEEDEEEIPDECVEGMSACDEADDCVPVGCSCTCSGCGFSYEDIVNEACVDLWYRQQRCEPPTACPAVCCHGETADCVDNTCVVTYG